MINLNRLRWLGHLLRVHSDRLPKRALFAEPPPTWKKRSEGRTMTWDRNLKNLTTKLSRMMPTTWLGSSWSTTFVVEYPFGYGSLTVPVAVLYSLFGSIVHSFCMLSPFRFPSSFFCFPNPFYDCPHFIINLFEIPSWVLFHGDQNHRTKYMGLRLWNWTELLSYNSYLHTIDWVILTGCGYFVLDIVCIPLINRSINIHITIWPLIVYDN